jgi:hypothetical protein
MKFVILGFSALIAVIALFLNLAIPAYRPHPATRLPLVVIPPTPDNVTIASILPLVNCRTYVQEHVPNVTNLVAFNGTALIASAASALATLAASLQGTGSITTLLSGNVTVNGMNVTLGYRKRYMTLGNGTFYYVDIPANGTLYHIPTNGTITLSLDGWTSPIYPGGGAYNATDPIFDLQQRKVQGAPLQMYLNRRSFAYTAIILTDPTTIIQAGSVMQVTRSLVL